MPLTDLPDAVVELIGSPRHERTATPPVERGVGLDSCASAHNGNPLFWDDDVAVELARGPILPPTTLATWSRPHSWSPRADAGAQPLQTHFDLKELLGLPEAVMTATTLTFGEPVRPGDVVTHVEVLRSVSAEKATGLGVGRFWEIDVGYRNQDGSWLGTESITGFGYRATPASPVATTAASVASPGPTAEATGSSGRPVVTAPADPPRRTVADVSVDERLPVVVHDVTTSTVVLGAMAARNWRPMHHDPEFARTRSGLAGIFLDTPTQAAWLERTLTDWSGPTGRPVRLGLRMRRPVLAGDRMTISGVVRAVEPATGRVTVDLDVTVGGEVRTQAEASLALPTAPGDNPWSRRGDEWMRDDERSWPTRSQPPPSSAPPSS